MPERFGFNFYIILLVAEIVVDFLVLVAEIGGVCIALQLVTGISFQWFALPVSFGIWLLLCKGTFGLIENGISLFRLITMHQIIYYLVFS